MAPKPRRRRRHPGRLAPTRTRAPIGNPEALERRQLLAASPWLDADDQPAFAFQTASAQPSFASRSLVVIDASASANGHLAGAFADAAATLVVGSGDDVFARVGAALDALDGVSAIHVVSHGSPGRFTLGDGVFSADTVDDLGPELVAWNRLAGPGSDLYLWGCDVAGGDGASLVDSIHALSGFDVAASIDVTGPAALGGDFDLEYAAGDVAAPALAAGVDVLWDTTLAAPAAYDFTSTTVKNAVNAAFERLETGIAPKIKTALANRTGSGLTDALAQRSIAELFGGSGSISPDDVAALLAVKTDVANYLGGASPTLAGLANALQAKLAALAATAGAASPTITVTPTVTKNLAGDVTAIELAVSIVARGTTTTPLDRGPDANPSAWGQVLGGLDSDLNLELRDTPQLETGSEFTGAFTISVDLADPDAPVASIAIPTLDLKAGLFGFAGVTGRIGALDLDSVRGSATPVHATSVTFSGGSTRTVADWSSVGATASALSAAPTATIDLPVTAKLGNIAISTADTKITVHVRDVLDAANEPVVTLAGFDKLQWFGAISSDDIITAVLAAGRAYGAVASAEGSILATRVPFAAEQTLGSIFDFADLFADEIGSKIDRVAYEPMADTPAVSHAFSVGGDASQITIAGDKSRVLQAGQKVALLKLTPAGATQVRTVQSVALDAGNTRVTLDTAVAGGITAGTLVPTIEVRPAELQTFGDFAREFTDLGITPVYDAARGTVALQFTASRTNTLSVKPAVEFPIAPLGALGFTPNTPAPLEADVDIAFGVRFDLAPSADLVLQLPAAAVSSGKLSGDASFTVTPAFGTAKTITLTQGATDDNTTRQQLLDQLNAALSGTPLTARESTSGGGFELVAAKGSTVPVAIKVTAGRSDGNRDLGFADGLGNDAGPITLLARTSASGSKIVPHATNEFATGSFAWSLAGRTGEVTYGLNSIGFTGTTGSVTADLGLTLAAEGAAADTLGSDPASVLTATLADDASITLAGLFHANGTSAFTNSPTITIAVADFTKERIAIDVPQGAPVAIANLEADGRTTGRLAPDSTSTIRFTWLDSTYEATVTAAEAADNETFADLVAQFAAQLPAFAVGGSNGRITIETLETADAPALAVVTGRLVPNLSAGGSTTGRLSADEKVEFLIGSTTYRVTVPRLATLDNTTFAHVVADFQAARANAERSVAGGDFEQNQNVSDELDFQASGSDLQPLAPVSVLNPGYATVAVPAKENLGDIGYQAGLTAASVATALRDAGRVFPMLAADLAAYAETVLPLVNAPLADLVPLDTGFAGRVETLRSASVTSIGALERAIETALGLPAKDLGISFDTVRNAYRIDLAYRTSATKKVGFDLALESYFGELGRLMPQGINELADANGKSPLTVVLAATSVLSVGIDLQTNQTFLYGYDAAATLPQGSTLDPALPKGTSFRIDVSVDGQNLEFPARLGFFVKGGTAKIENGALVATLAGPAGTPGSASFYVSPTGVQRDALDVANYAAAFAGKVEVVMPIFDEFAPATVTAASASEAGQYGLKHPASLYLGIPKLGDYYRTRGQIEEATASLLALRQSGRTNIGAEVDALETVIRSAEQRLPNELKVFAPELTAAKELLGAGPTLIDAIRDPAIILDTLDTVLRYAENSMAGIGKLDLPLIGNSLGGAVNGLFGFRRGWLLDMRNKLRGQGESLLDVMRQQVFDFLGPQGTGILLVNNGLRSAEGMVGATKPTDVGLEFLDAAGKKVATGVRGADAFEITVRIGQKLFDTGVDLGFQFDALEPLIKLGLDGGLRLQLGWDIQLGFGFSLTNGAYIKLDPDSPEAQVRFDATLTGKSAQFKPQWVSEGVWKIVDGNGRDVIDPATGSAYRAIAVDKGGNDVTGSVPKPGSDDAQKLDPCQDGTPPAKTSSGSQVWWVVGAQSGGTWVPAELNGAMRYVPRQSTDVGSLIEVSAMAPASLSGSLAFLTLTATDMVRRGLTGVTDYDNTYLFDASDGPQTDAKARDNPDKGVNRNNQLATMFSGVIGIDIVDPSANKKAFQAVPDDAVGPDKLKLADAKGAGVKENGNAVPVRKFYEFKLRQGPGAAYKPLDRAVRVATTANIRLAGVGIVDGVQLRVNDRVLVKNQVDAKRNGVYVVGSGDWNRALDADANAEWNGGQAFVFVEEGRTNKQTGWAVDERVYAPGDIDLGATDIIFTRVETVSAGGVLKPYEPFTTVLLPEAVVDKPLTTDFKVVIFYDNSEFIVTLPATQTTGAANRAAQLSFALRNGFEDRNGNRVKDGDEPSANLLQDGFAFPIPTEPKAKAYVIEQPQEPATGTRAIQPDGWYPVRDINADSSKNRLTFNELRTGGLAIFKVDVSATAVANFQLELSLGESATLPKIFAELNLDWSTKSARAKLDKAAQDAKDQGGSGAAGDAAATAATGADKGIDPNAPKPKEFDLLPEIGISNVRLDLGSFLTKFVRPIVKEASPYIKQIQPIVDFLTMRIDPLSAIAGTDIKVLDLLEKFGGPKAQKLRPVVDTVQAISTIAALVEEVPTGVNVQLPLGRFWFPKEANKQTGQYEYGAFRYDNKALSSSSGDKEAIDKALDVLTKLKEANPDSAESARKQKAITSAADRGGFRMPILENPLTAFKLMMGQDVSLFTFQLPKVQYQLEKSIPLARIVCFEVGLKMGFELNSKLAFGFDTYGFRLFGDSGDVLDIGQGFYVSDRANADGTGPDTPEFQAIVNFGLYGGIDVLIAKGGVEGGVRVTAEVDLNDPNNDGKLRLPEFFGLLTDHDDAENLLDPFDLSLRGEIYARYYYDVFGLISGGADFARFELFNLKREGRDGPPIPASKITSQADDGTPLPNTLLIHAGDNAAKRVSNEDPLGAKDGNEEFTIRRSGNSVFVKYRTFAEQEFTGIDRVIFSGGLGNDSLDASHLDGIPLFFDGGDGNDWVKLGSGSDTASRIDGGDGDDTIEVVGGGKVEIRGGLGVDRIKGGTGTVWIDPGAGNDIVETKGGSTTTTTISFSDQYGLDTLTLDPDAAVNLLDFTNVYSSVVFGLEGTNGSARAGDANSASFNVPGLTEIRGTSSPDTFRVTNPTTRNANDGKGLILRGSLGDDVYEFTIDAPATIAADGILVDDVRPVVTATAGAPTVSGVCQKIQSIPVTDAGSGYTVAPDVVIVDSKGSSGYGAKATATIDEQGRVVSIQVIDKGQGYTNPTVLLVNPVSYSDKLTFTSSLSAATLTRDRTTYTLGVGGKTVRFEGWGGVGEKRPAGFDTSEIDSVTVNLPQGVFTLGAVDDRLGDSIDLFDTFTVNAERMVQNARIVADTVAITTDHGFQVRHAIDTTNSGDIRVHVTGKANNDDPLDDINVAANLATATAKVSGGSVTGLEPGKAGNYYFFDPSITVGAEIASAGTGARFTANRDGDSLSGFTKLSGGSGYFTTPAPLVVIPPPASIQIDAMVTSSAPGGLAGLGDGRGRVILHAETGMVSTSGEVFFPKTRPEAPDNQRVIDWIGGDYRYRSTTTLDDLVNATTYPGISVGTGAEFEAILDADGRVTGFQQVNPGSGYSKDLPPQVEIEGLATATAVVDDKGTITSLTVTYPGDGYGQPPRVTIRPNGFGRIVDSPSGPTKTADDTPLNRVHIRSIGGTLVAVAGAGVGDLLKPLKSDVETFVARVTGDGRGVHVLEKDGVRIGSAVDVDGIFTVNGPVTFTTFGGAIELGAPKQALDAQGRPLWQDAAKTIPIYERDPVTNKIVYEGGQIDVGTGSVKLTADDVEVNVPLGGTTKGGTIEIQPVKVNAQIGLAGTRARTAAIIDHATGAVTGFDATKFWGGRGYTSAPLVIVDPAGQRAFGTAVVQNNAVVAIDVVFGGTNYSATEPPTIAITGGGGSGAEARANIGPGGAITSFTIINGGGGYSSAPFVLVESPGQALVEAILETKPDPVTGRYAVKEFVIKPGKAGRNYTAAPNIEVAAPYDFTLDGDEIAQFDTAFKQVVIGRIEGQHLFHSPEASLGSGVVLRAPRAGGTLDMALLSATGPISIVGSGNTFHFDAATPTVTGSSISIEDNVIVHMGVTGTVTATDNAITIRGSGMGMIDGAPTGTDVGDDEDLTLSAQTTVTVAGAVGSRWKLDDLTVTSRGDAAIALQQSVSLTGALAIDGGAVTIGGVVNVGDDLVVDSTAAVLFSEDVTVAGDLWIKNASDVTFAGRLTVLGTVRIDAVPGTVRFNALVDARSTVAIAAGTLLDVANGFMAGGDATFAADEVNFKGGQATVIGPATGTLTIKPSAAGQAIRVGSPAGSPANTLDVSDTDLAAIAGGWKEVVIGDATTGTGTVTIGTIGTTHGSRNSWLANPTTIVGGSVTVAERVDVAATAAYLRLRSRTGAVAVNAAINAATIVSLDSATTTSQTATAAISTSGLRVNAGGAVTLEAPGNDFSTLAVATTNDAISIREDSGYTIGTVDGTSGISVGTATATLRSSGSVGQTAAGIVAAATLDLRGAGGAWTLADANQIGTLTADTGSLAVADAGEMMVGSIVASKTSGTAVELSAPTRLTLTGPVTTSGGAARFNDAVTLAADTTVTTGAGAATFAAAVDGPFRLVVAATGDTTFAAAVGAKDPLAHLETDAAGRTLLDGGAVTTVGSASQHYRDAVVLGINTVLTANGGGAITFGGTVDGATGTSRSLDIINTSGTTTFGGAVGNTTPLASLSTDTLGTSVLAGGLIRTTGGQTWRDATVLVGVDTVLRSDSAGIAATADTTFSSIGRTVAFVAATGVGSLAVPIRVAAPTAVTATLSGSGGIFLTGVGDLLINAGGLSAPTGTIALDASGLIRVPDGGRIAAGPVPGLGVTTTKPIHWSVTRVANAGFGSLRQAINNANTTGVEGRVLLDGPALPAGTVRIAVGSALPVVATRLTIDTTTGRRLELDGVGTVPTGLSFGARSTGSLIAGVTLVNFRDNGIVLDASPGVTIRGCVIQANGNGIRASGNQTGSQIVGNTRLNANRAYGIHLYAATGLTIDGNTVTGLNTLASMGLYATGTLTNTVVVNTTFSGGLRGALLQNARGLVFGRLGQGNTLSDNVSVRSQPNFAGTGIRAEGDMTGTTVTGNMFARNNYGFGFVGARGLRLIGNIFVRNTIAAINVDGDNTGSSQTTNTFGTGANANKANIVRAKGSRGI
jgi:hypothetical protein